MDIAAPYLSGLDLSNNPFHPSVFIAPLFPWQPPVRWESISAPECQVVLHTQHLDALLTASKLQSQETGQLSRSFVSNIRPLSTPAELFDYIARKIALWWSDELVKTPTLLFTMPLGDAVLVMRLLMWAWGSRDGVELALRVREKSPESTRPIIQELKHREASIGNMLDVSLQALQSWIAVIPEGIGRTTIFFVAMDRQIPAHMFATLSSLFGDSYPSLIYRLFLYPNQVPTFHELAPCKQYRLHWHPNDLTAMVDKAVLQAGDKTFDGLVSQLTILRSEVLTAALGDELLLDWLARRANGSLARLMLYCDSILQSYRRRCQRDNDSDPAEGILASDVERALTRLGLLHDSRDS